MAPTVVNMERRRGQRPGYKPHSDEIYRLRVRVHGLSRAEVAAKVGYSYDSIKSAELGNNISELLASRLAKVFGVEVEDIATPPQALASLDAKNGPAAGTTGPAGDETRTKHNRE